MAHPKSRVRPRSSPSVAGGEPSGAPQSGQPGALAAGLHVVATPIGNLRDITLRALDVLAAAGTIACEDTRVTAKLLAAHGLSRPLVACHDHNAARAIPLLIGRLKDGGSVALVTDAGTPLVSDPGYALVRAAQQEGIPVRAVPGAASPMAALSVAGLPADRVLFAGFLPSRGAARRATLGELAGVPATLVLLEAPHRLPESLADMAAMLGPREAAVARELTKLFEEVRRGTLETLAAHYANTGPPKGEIVVVIAPPAATAVTGDDEIDALLAAALRHASRRDAVAEVAAATGRPKREVYARALARDDGD
ncbi:MAG: 16S rRNA (cytidine(1402)-2'-O)-methyltransferase [Alphaproteobacteria bacterium]|nr:16S rRNA (cytidine(1402)-2'-O)-methyltransferase [Alphaproteobacteria bacterium]